MAWWMAKARRLLKSRDAPDEAGRRGGVTAEERFLFDLEGYLVIKHAPGATVGTLIAFMTLVGRFYSPLQELTQLSRQIQHASTAASQAGVPTPSPGVASSAAMARIAAAMRRRSANTG